MITHVNLLDFIFTGPGTCPVSTVNPGYTGSTEGSSLRMTGAGIVRPGSPSCHIVLHRFPSPKERGDFGFANGRNPANGRKD